MSENIKNEWPKLLFLDGYDESAIDEAFDKGYVNFVLVELEDGRKYEIEFTDGDSVSRTLASTVTKSGKHFTTEPGLILLTEVTIENMYEAVRELSKHNEFGFFGHLKEWSQEKHERFLENTYPGIEYRYLPITKNSAYVNREIKRCGWEVRQQKKNRELLHDVFKKWNPLALEYEEVRIPRDPYAHIIESVMPLLKQSLTEDALYSSLKDIFKNDFLKNESSENIFNNNLKSIARHIMGCATRV